MYVLMFLLFLAILIVVSKIYIVLTRPLSQLKKEHYNMDTVNSLRVQFSRFVRKDEQHLIHH
jgi:hypothetical protein